MSRTRSHLLVLVTAPDLEVARRLARAVLEAPAAACANLIPGIESHYWWRGRMESANEILILFKTTRARLKVLEQAVLAHHPYDTPEIIALPLQEGLDRYLAWIDESVNEHHIAP